MEPTLLEPDHHEDDRTVRRSYPLLAALSAGAAAIHFAMVPAHAAEDVVLGVGFAVAAWFQLVIAVLVFTRPTRQVLIAAIAGNAAILGVWVMSRTVGLPIGEHVWHPEEISSVDLLCSALEAGIVIGAAYVLARPAAAAKAGKGLSMAGIIGALAVLGLTTAALASPDARHDHHGDHGEVAAGGHGHESGSHDMEGGDMEGHDMADMEGHDAEGNTDVVAVDDRCDLEFNTAAYYEDADIAGLDPLGTGGSSQEHEHSTEGDVNNPMAHDEGAAAANIVRLSKASDEDYNEWLASLDPNREGAAPDDTKAGGHSGPQIWTPMTDDAECEQLAADIDLARETALSYPTPVEAKAAGYTMVTGFVPGIASHWMKFGIVDGTFDITQPEMLLYDGTSDTAQMIGLSYYVIKDGDAEPTDGFGGGNDHYHRHIGLCVKGTVVIGGSNTTAEECAARGGQKSGGGSGWMSHAWVVPGCESPWGVFSGENPKLDAAMSSASGQGEACSGALRQFDDTPGPASIPEEDTENASGD